MPRRYYKVDLYARGVVSTTGTITKTWGTTDLSTAELVVGGQVVRPLEGRAESQPWTVRVIDRGSTVSSLLANSSQRMHLLSRLLRVRRATDSTQSSAFQTIGVSRVTDVALGQDVASYDFTCQDDRWVERNVEIFKKANTAMVIPPGLISGWAQFPATPVPTWAVVAAVGNLICLRYDGTTAGGTVVPLPQSDQVLRLIENDIKLGAIAASTAVTVGNFVTLRWHNAGNSTDYEVVRFGATFGASPANILYPWVSMPLLTGLRPELASPLTKLHMWVVWTAAPPAVGTTVSGYCYMPTHIPTPDLPLHLGGSSGDHPFSLAEKVYQGTYSTGGTLLPRISTAAFDTLKNDSRYGRTWMRVTGPQVMASFLESRIFQPYAAVPTVNSSGKIAPVSVLSPGSTLPVATLPTLTASNLTAHPTWTHPSREIVNVLQANFEHYNYIRDTRGVFDMPADRLKPIAASTANSGVVSGWQYWAGGVPDQSQQYDNTTLMGRRIMTVQYGVIHFPDFTPSTAFPGVYVYQMGAVPFHQAMAASLFNRFGDGPIYTDVEATTAIDNTTNGKVQPGNYVKVQLGTYPNPGTNARGSTRLMQVLARRDGVAVPILSLLDAGAGGNALPAPSLALALSSQSSRHAVKATVSAMPGAARYELQIGYGATGAGAPVFYVPIANNTTASLVQTIGSIPANTKVFARAKAMRAARIDSAFSAVQSVITAKIPGPTGMAVSGITAGTAVAKWTNGSSQYAVEAMADDSTAGVLGTSRRVATLPALTTRYDFAGFAANHKQQVGVRHRDPFGGFSTQSVTTFTTTTGLTAAPSLAKLVIVEATS